LPERESVLLMLLCKGGILLEKRPPSGIWGGLWSLPEIAPGGDPAQAVRARFGVEIAALQHLPPRRHVFTHFRLCFTPVLARVRAFSNEVRQPGALWLPLQEALGAALPAPVRKLIEELNHEPPR
jgi:A/G-specific adenine glycosylase